ncbi:FAD-dependent oxidoreductase [Vibrio hippocampi]|uniref:Fumarate reductase flavoprotein subunit n=1 Tax=Vibrio hippocampi TaxID=654686 RepID=A0ABM8ZMK9_9VIBR|nr:FAD-binding protein [Vibrio hippocampi]CAH0529531.1 Fumarate reductase flavoprotein subunit [Vibrio hippocampi]
MNKAVTKIETDVLVIGGGFAGCYASIKAAEQGAKVVMAVKGRTGRSGLTPWANSWFVYHETKGVTREQYIQQFKLSGEYLNNLDYSEILMNESWDRFQELVAWGTPTGRQYYYQPGTVSRSIEYVGAGDPMRKRAVEVGVNLLERVMVTTLIKQEDKVVGAVGFHMESGRPYAILAKATVMCAGPASFKPLGMGYPCSSTTADGDAMAYRVGAEISGKEFNDAHPSNAFNPLDESSLKSVSGDGNHKTSVLKLGGGPPSAPGPADTLKGEQLGLRIDKAIGFNQGGNPIEPKYCAGPGGEIVGRTDERGGHVGFSTLGMSNHKGEGVFPQDLNGASNIAGLWAAGDGLCSMQNGAGYAGFGSSSSGSAVQGARAGIAAAHYAAEQPSPVVDEATLSEYKNRMFAPMTREKGYSPAWVTRMLQNTMSPYFVMYVKERSRMEGALNHIMYLQNKFASQLKVYDFHDLRSAHETQNMLLNAEMKLRAGLAREESRGTHYREDFPYRDDANFLCWIKLVNKEGAMQVVKHPIPEKWHPAANLSYRDKYPFIYPEEDEKRLEVGIEV